MLFPEAGSVSSQHNPQGRPVAPRTGIATKGLVGTWYKGEEIWSFTLESKVTYFSSHQLHGGCRAAKDIPISQMRTMRPKEVKDLSLNCHVLHPYLLSLPCTILSQPRQDQSAGSFAIGLISVDNPKSQFQRAFLQSPFLYVRLSTEFICVHYSFEI